MGCGGGFGFGGGATSPGWQKFTVTHAQLQAAALNNSVLIFNLPAAGVVEGCKVKHSIQFAGVGFTSYKVSVGLLADLQRYSLLFDVLQAVGDGVGKITNLKDWQSQAGVTAIYVGAVATGANLNVSTAGSVDIWIEWDTTP